MMCHRKKNKDETKTPCDSDNENCFECNEYPQIEIKLLRFINNINKQATKTGGRIIKLLGNHELMNIIDSDNEDVKDYQYDSHLKLPNYYHGETRSDIFKVGREGFNLLFEDKCYILIKINNNIFVHGQLPKFPINKIIEINNFLNNSSNQALGNESKWIEKMNEYNNGIDGLLWDREWAQHDKINTRINTSDDKFCESNIKKDLRIFMGESEDINKLRVIVGHCVQSNSTLFDMKNTTFSHSESLDANTLTFSGRAIHDKKTADLSDPGKIFGITMQCPKDKVGDYQDFFVYHIDVGSSRGFDTSLNYNKEIKRDWLSTMSISKSENKYLFSRTPQVLSIEPDRELYNPKITIIKSKMRNTRIHLPRFKYENIHGRNRDLSLENSRYNKKYLKYKNKYLKLKIKLFKK